MVFFAASAVVDVAVDVPRLPSNGDRGGPMSLVWNGRTMPSKPDNSIPHDVIGSASRSICLGIFKRLTFAVYGVLKTLSVVGSSSK